MTLDFPRTRTLLMSGASVATVVLALSVTLNTKFDIGLVPPVPASIGETDASALKDVEIGRTSTSPETPAADIPAQPSQRSAVNPENRAREREPAGLADAESTGSQQSWNQTFYFSPPAPLASESAPAEQPAPGYVDQGRDRFKEIDENDVKAVVEDPVSTFSIDVDTASYSFVRSSLMNGFLPQKAAVRVEEMINYFPYDYSRPKSPGTPFSTDVTVMPTPWNANTKLMRIAIQGYDVAPVEKPRTNIVFLIDTSGSMNAPDKLPLLRNSFRMLVDRLDPDDTVSIVVYAGSAGTVLEPTKVSEKAKILASLDQLAAGGSTAGGEGIRQAYRLAEANFDAGGVNRVLLATDGDFNVGITNPVELKGLVERKRETGIFLSVLGFGRGNYNDRLMQALAENGNGQAAYIDTLNEARKVLVDEASSTLFPIAKDVKIQVEFNPATVSEYRLIGYETRILDRADFNNDKVDAGEIGSGHAVTALYEIRPVGAEGVQIDPLRYQVASEAEDAASDEIAFVKLRYKQPDETESSLITRPVTGADERPPDTEARFAAAVAAFGQLLRGGEHTGSYGYDDVIALGTLARGDDPFGYRAEFLNLVRLAKSAAALEQQK